MDFYPHAPRIWYAACEQRGHQYHCRSPKRGSDAKIEIRYGLSEPSSIVLTTLMI